MLLPDLTSLNAAGVLAAMEYRVGFTGAKPVVAGWPRYWLIIAKMAVNVGADAEVPPTPVKHDPVGQLVDGVLESLNAVVQLVGSMSVEQTKYASWSGDALKEISGTSRLLSFGTPVPVCQIGFEK